ncbi:MAG: AAA family ATPase [Candidatus Nanohaloarchaea archaeon]|nr:AAA family ATPase [Candidatus Nanohaloarchaea archaeon]
MKQWLRERGWNENPFNFKIYPDLMVGYEEEISRLDEAISAGNKFSVVVGRTGAGKTNLLKWLASHHEDEREVHYLPKPPTHEEDFLQYLRDEVLDPGFFARLLNDYSLYNIHNELHDALDDHVVMIIDEAHEASHDVLQWMRTVIDHVDSLTVVAAGLPEFESTLEEDINTLYSRATHITSLDSLDRDESVQLIRERIKKAGGTSIEPFTQDALLEIYDVTDGFPREVLRACNDCVVHAAREGKSIIDAQDVEEILDDREAAPEEEDDGEESGEPLPEVQLTEKQEEILDVLEEKGRCTSGDIVDSRGYEDYSSRSHAVRSVNNILNRLRENGLVAREREGRSYVYFLDT